MRARRGFRSPLPPARQCPAQARARKRAGAGGFSLIELMVVVILVAVLAVIAAPAMRVARDDRMTFDYARQISQIIHRARARAAARGGAHLVAISKGPAGRGRFFLFEALDGTTALDGGPRPVASCKGATQWTEVASFTPGTVGLRARIVEGLDLNSNGVNVDANILTNLSVNGATTDFVAICVAPSGSTQIAPGGDINTAISAMQTTGAFTGILDILVQRHTGAGAAMGLERHIYVTAGGAPRIRSN